MKATAAALALLAIATPALAQGWSDLGGSSSNGGPAGMAGQGFRPAVAQDANHNYYVAWSNVSGAAKNIYLLKWDIDSSAWVELAGSASGSGLNAAGAATDPRIACGYDSVADELKVFVAWTQTDALGKSDIHAAAWKGATGTWADLGAAGATGRASQPSLALDWTQFDVMGPWGNVEKSLYAPWPCVAWVDDNAGVKDIIVKGLNDAGGWDDSFHFTYKDKDDVDQTGHVGVLKSGHASSPSLGFYARHIPAVAWVDDSSGNPEVYYREGHGQDATWIERSASASAGGVSGAIGKAARPVLVFVDGVHLVDRTPAIAWENDLPGVEEIHLKMVQWTGTKYDWAPVDPTSIYSLVSAGSTHAAQPTLCYDESNWPVVAWTETLDGGNREIYLRRWSGASWEPEWGSALGGGISQTAGASTFPAMMAASYASFLVVWEDAGASGSRVLLKVLDANGWVELARSGSQGGLSNLGDAADQSSQPALAVGPDDRPVVAYIANTTQGGRGWICLKKWNGSAWTGLGGSDVDPGVANYLSWSIIFDRPSLAIAADGSICVAWSQKLDGNSINYYVFAKKWNGTQWIDFPNLSVPVGGSSTQPSIALDASGNPVVAWSHVTSYSGPSDIYVRGWNGTQWVDYGTSASGAGVSNTAIAGRPSTNPTIKVDASGRPVVAWVERTTNQGAQKIWLRRWNPATQAWDELVDDQGATSATGSGVSKDSTSGDMCASPCLSLDAAGRPNLAWSQSGRIIFSRWNGTSWEPLGDSTRTDPVGTANNISMELDPQGWPVIAWDGVYLKRWDGGAWVEQGRSASNSGIGGGFRYPTAVSRYPALGLDRWGNPTVCWADAQAGSPSISHIYLRQRPNFAPILGGLGQFRLDGATPIAAGAISTEEAGVVIRASVDDANAQPITLDIQVLPAGQAFGPSTPFVSGGPFTADTTGSVAVVLPVSGRYREEYHWRVRARDIQDKASEWISFGATDASTDFILRSNEAPAATGAGQSRADGTAIPAGAVLGDGFQVAFSAGLEDEDLDAARFEIECRRLDEGFEGRATASSSAAAPGTRAEILMNVAPGAYHWQYRAVDAFEKASAWRAQGAAGVADFSFLGGSFGNATFGCHARPGVGSAGLLAALLVLVAARRK